MPPRPTSKKSLAANPLAPDALQAPADQGISLESLADGLAGMIDRGEDPYDVVTVSSPAADENSPTIAREAPQRAGGPDISPRSILEAMLFVGQPANQPLSAQRVASLMRGVRPAEIDDYVRELNEQYAENACPYTIQSEAGGYRLALRDEFHGLRDRLAGRHREVRLSRAAIEVLALVAYNESISRDEISRIRGRTSGGVLAQLVRRQLLKIERTPDEPRQARYSTTGRFLQLFGLESLADLPRSQDVEQR